MTTRSRLSYLTFQFGNGTLSPTGWRSSAVNPTWSIHSFTDTTFGPNSGTSWTDNGNGTFTNQIRSTNSYENTNVLRVKFQLDNPNDVFAAYNGIDKDRLRLIIHDMKFRPRITVTTPNGGPTNLGNAGVGIIKVSNRYQWNGAPPSVQDTPTYRYGKSVNNSFTMPFNTPLGLNNNYNWIGQDVEAEVETNLGSGQYSAINIGQSTFATQRPFNQFDDPNVIYIEYTFTHANNIDANVTVAPVFGDATGHSQTYYWFAGAINIDGQDGDSIDTMAVNTTTNFIAAKKFNSDVTVATQTALTEASANRKICPAVNMSAGQATMSITPSFKIGPSLTKSVITALQATTENFVRMDALTMSAGQSTMTTTPAFKLSTANLNIAAQAQTTFGSNMIYDIFTEYTWDSFNLNTYFELGYAQGQYALEQGEYTWDFTGDFTWDTWASVTWIGNEESWDNWPEDVWDRKYKIRSQGALTLSTLFKLGKPLTVNSQIVLATDPGFNIPLEATTIQAQSAVLEARATGKIEVSVSLSGVFANATVAAAEYGPGITTATQVTTTFVGNTITDTTQTLAATSASTIAGLKRKPGEMSNSVAVATDFDPNIIYGPTLAIAAITVKVTTTRIIYQGDPYYLIKVPAENRQLMVPAENRITLIEGENRVNMIKADTRTVLVPEETRRIKLRIPPLSNRLSTPRVRSEA